MHYPHAVTATLNGKTEQLRTIVSPLTAGAPPNVARSRSKSPFGCVFAGGARNGAMKSVPVGYLHRVWDRAGDDVVLVDDDYTSAVDIGLATGRDARPAQRASTQPRWRAETTSGPIRVIWRAKRTAGPWSTSRYATTVKSVPRVIRPS